MTDDDEGIGPLAGFRVIDVSTVLAGPTAAQLLGDFGAEVIKVEHPTAGDSLRNHGESKDGEPLWWKIVGRNKRSVGIYLGEPEGADLLLKLARGADVLIESFRPGVLESYGLTMDRLQEANPSLVVLRVSGFGQSGPYSNRPGFGTLIEAMSGFAHLTGSPDGPPTLAPFGLADSVAGIAGALAVSMALVHRERSGGVGQVIDLSLLEPLMAVLGAQTITYDQLGIVGKRMGNRSQFTAPRNVYRCSDGKWVAVAASTASTARRVLRLVGREDIASAEWFSSALERSRRVEEIDGYVAEWVARRSRAEVLQAFADCDAAAAPVYDVADLVEDTQVREREMVLPVHDPRLGEVLMPNVLFRLSKTPGRIRFTGRTLGADTRSVLSEELGLSDAELERLGDKGIIAC